MLSTLPINPKLEVEVYENDLQEKYAMYIRYKRDENADGDVLFEVCFYDKGLQELINNKTYIYQFYEPISPEDRKLLGSAYNPTNNDNAYAGYMYGYVND